MKKFFTILELLIVIAVIAIVITLLLPALNSAKAKARTIQCMNQNSAIGKALIMYTNDNNAWFVFTNSATAPTGDYNWAETLEKLYMGNRKRNINLVPAGWWCPAFPLGTAMGGNPGNVIQKPRFDANNCTWAINVYNTAKNGVNTPNRTLARKKISSVRSASQVIMNGDSDEIAHMASFWKAPSWGKPGIGGMHPGKTSPAIFVDGHGQLLLQAFYSKQYNDTNTVFRWWTYNNTTPNQIEGF